LLNPENLQNPQLEIQQHWVKKKTVELSVLTVSTNILKGTRLFICPTNSCFLWDSKINGTF